VKFERFRGVSLSNRLDLVRVFEGFCNLTVHYGFVRNTDLPSALRVAKDLGCPAISTNGRYFGGTTLSSLAKLATAVAVAFDALRLLVRNSVRAVTCSTFRAQLRGNWRQIEI